MIRLRLSAAIGGALLAVTMGMVAAHDIDEAGTHVCIEGNYMMANAMNTPFGEQGPGQVIEMNIFTGTPGLTVMNPFSGANAGTDICPGDMNAGDNAYVECPGPWKPTGVLSGGLNGHAIITSAGQQALTELHRDGTPIRSLSYRPLLGNPTGPAGRGTLPRPLGTQMMPNGNIIQAICDANFFNASNSDVMGPGESGITFNAFPGPPVPSDNSSYLYFPPVYNTDERQDNSRLLVIDQETLEIIDEYSRPAPGEPGHDLWGCAAGIVFSEEGMFISTFHGAAVLVIDWKAGLEEGRSTGVGSNSTVSKGKGNGGKEFHLGDGENRAEVKYVIDFRLGEDADSPWRRDSLRAISFDESGNIYATDRERSRECVRGEAPGAVVPNPSGNPPCNPSVFRQRVNIASVDGYNDPSKRRTVALDPGVNVIAGIRSNRMSGPACDYVRANPEKFAHTLANGAPGNPYGYEDEEDLCDVETVLVAASAMNDGEIFNGGCVGGHPANACFKPGGSVVEYLTHPNWTDGGPGWGGDCCNGDPTDPASNAGCARPVARFPYRVPDDNVNETPVDPRMLMVIHEAFVQ